jgi:glycosyltransferase involved in cell wall biosynthesis
MSEASVSVVIAAFNRGPRIAETLDTVLTQTRPALEVVVADDGSTDGTAAFVRERYPHVRLVTLPHGGQSVARNSGAREARGDVVVFFDSDDVMLPHALETLADCLGRFPEARAAFADHRYENAVTGLAYENHHATQPQFGRLKAVPATRTDGQARLYGRSIYYTLLRGNLLQQPWAVYRDTFLASGGFAADLRSNEDWDLFMRLAYDVPLVLTDRVISTHRVEKHKDHVHLSAGLDETNTAVIRRHLRARRWRDPRAWLILRRRLASYLKTAGDRARSASLRRAWRHYAGSLWLWPFDHVVAARALVLWPAQLVAGRG